MVGIYEGLQKKRGRWEYTSKKGEGPGGGYKGHKSNGNKTWSVADRRENCAPN